MSAAQLHREDAAWLAGLLDGEGCFDNPRGNPRIRVKMSDVDVVIRAADVMGATVYTEPAAREGHLDLAVAQLTGERAVGVLRAILPWLGARRTAKATEIITAYAARKSGRIRLLKIEEPPPLRVA